MSSSYEGDLIRPLGLVTLYFGYAEFEIDAFIQRLHDTGRLPVNSKSRLVGQKLRQLSRALRAMDPMVQSALAELLKEGRRLLEHRNTLVHGCILAGGKITSGQAGIEQKCTSVEELNALAESIFNWKERLSVFRWRQVEPLLAVPSGPGATKL